MQKKKPKRMKLLEELVRGYQARLRSYVFSRTGSMETSDDIVQEVFLVAFKRIEEYDVSRPAWPWLMGIARNELREHWRAVARESNADHLHALAALRQLDADERRGPNAHTEQRLDALQACLEKLPARSRELVRIIYTDRLNCLQAARRWRKGEAAVRMAIHRIRKTLRSCVESQVARDLA